MINWVFWARSDIHTVDITYAVVKVIARWKQDIIGADREWVCTTKLRQVIAQFVQNSCSGKKPSKWETSFKLVLVWVNETVYSYVYVISRVLNQLIQVYGRVFSLEKVSTESRESMYGNKWIEPVKTCEIICHCYLGSHQERSNYLFVRIKITLLSETVHCISNSIKDFFQDGECLKLCLSHDFQYAITHTLTQLF